MMDIKKSFSIIVLLIFSLICLHTIQAQSIDICPLIPFPQKSERVQESFPLTNKTVIVCNDPCLSDLAYLLQNEVLKYENVCPSIGKNVSNVLVSSQIVLKLTPQKKKPNETFSITMNEKKVVIEGVDKQGVYNGVMSFIQLARLSDVKNGRLYVACWNIYDYPKYEWRGFMLDEARHFFGKEKVKQILDWMALYKLNRFHWHLTDMSGWRIEIKKYPLLAHVGGIGDFGGHYVPSQWNPNTLAKFYTQAEIKEIVAYASERMIEVIPEIDMPGHASAAIRAYPEFGGGGTPPVFINYTFNPAKDTVYTFLTDILKEIDVLFPSQIIHLGGDEVHYGNKEWNTDETIQMLMKKENMTKLKEVENYFFERIADSLFLMNNKLAAWDEVAESKLPSEKTIVFFWRHTRPEQLQKALENNFPVVLCPRNPFYFDYQQDSLQVYGPDGKKFGYNSIEKIYHFTKEVLGINYPKDASILGVQANLWTERIITENRLDYMLFPRIAALAETAWTQQENKDIDGFKIRLTKQFKLYKEDGIYYSDPFEPQKTGEPVN